MKTLLLPQQQKAHLVRCLLPWGAPTCLDTPLSLEITPCYPIHYVEKTHPLPGCDYKHPVTDWTNSAEVHPSSLTGGKCQGLSLCFSSLKTSPKH